MAIFRVKDTGVGIEPEMLPKIFELFTQLDQSTARIQGGLEIGLRLSRNLAELHGGTLTASSEGKGKGSEFILRLPLRQTDTAKAKKEKEGEINRKQLLF